MKKYAYQVMCMNTTTQINHGVVATSVANAIAAVQAIDETLEIVSVNRAIEITVD
jgi:hypothetical protein